MKKLMIMGALVGFSSGLLLGILQGASWPDVMWRASLVSFASSYIFRWWGRMWLKALHQAQEQQRLELASANSAPPAKV